MAAVLGASCGAERSAPLGHELVPATEKADIARVIKMFEVQVAARDGAGPTLRGAHPKHHGCVNAQFVVLPDLAQQY
jgi:hypothetical protein